MQSDLIEKICRKYCVAKGLDPDKKIQIRGYPMDMPIWDGYKGEIISEPFQWEVIRDEFKDILLITSIANKISEKNDK